MNYDGAELFRGMFMFQKQGRQKRMELTTYLAMALAQECGTILMDEPTTFLDIFHQIQVLNLAKRLAQSGKAVALVLHDLPLAFSFADRAALLYEGQLLQQGTPEELLASDRLSAVFGVGLRKTWDGNICQSFYVRTATQ